METLPSRSGLFKIATMVTSGAPALLLSLLQTSLSFLPQLSLQLHYILVQTLCCSQYTCLGCPFLPFHFLPKPPSSVTKVVPLQDLPRPSLTRSFSFAPPALPALCSFLPHCKVSMICGLLGPSCITTFSSSHHYSTSLLLFCDYLLSVCPLPSLSLSGLPISILSTPLLHLHPNNYYRMLKKLPYI